MIPLPALKDVTELVDRFPFWKRLKGLVGRMDALEAKIAELEARLEVQPGEVCRYCGAPAMRLLTPMQMNGEGPGSWCYEQWQCHACNNLDIRIRKY